MVNPTGTVRTVPSALPATVIEDVPLGLDAEVVTVITESAPGATGFGLNDTAVPAGWPVALKVISPGVPETVVGRTVYEVDEPAATVCDEGVAAKEKSDDGVHVGGADGL
jgi:hypothetical protein